MVAKMKRSRRASKQTKKKLQEAEDSSGDESHDRSQGDVEMNEVAASVTSPSGSELEEEENASNQSEEDSENDDDAVSGGEENGNEVNFANLVDIGVHSDSSDEDAPIEAMAISKLPTETIKQIRNDEPALEKKLAEISIFAGADGKEKLPFRESLTVTMPLDAKLSDHLALDDLKREQKFAELTTAAVHIGLGRLRRSKVKFRRPGDYFAEMVKTDVQMAKVKATILHHKEKIESAEKRRNNREISKNKKKVRSVQMEREQDKKRKAREEIEAFSDLRKKRLRERAGETGGKDDGSDDEFPIDLLEVEQLDDENKFQKHSDIKSGRKKAWKGQQEEEKKGGKRENSGADGGKFSRKGGRRDGGRGKGKNAGGSEGAKHRGNGGVKKSRGSKKRLGRSRRLKK